MNMKRFAAPTTREAMNLVRAAFGDDAVVLSTKPCPSGIEVLAMAPEGLDAIQRQHSSPAPAPAPLNPATSSPREDADRLGLSTLGFQDYVRQRMLRRRQAEMAGQPDPAAAEKPARTARSPLSAPELEQRAAQQMQVLGAKRIEPTLGAPVAEPLPEPQPIGRADTRAAAAQALQMNARMNVRQEARERVRPAPEAAIATPPTLRRNPPVLQEVVVPESTPAHDYGAQASRQERSSAALLDEMRAMKGLIEERFGALAFMEKLQRQPLQARLAQRLLEVGFSPLLTRKLVEACPSAFAEGADEQQWAQAVLARNLSVAPQALEARQGVFALIGSTGVGKTTTTAKIAAAFAARHGAGQLGLITLDAYRLGAHEQLRAYGRILGAPVHTAHDRASLEDLLDLLANKQLILIDTAGMAQRDSRTAELLDMLAHPSIRKLLVLAASSQGETLEDGIQAWKAASCEGVIVSKLDEAVRLAPALDCLVRHKLPVQGVANGQRVPEDWLRLTADALVQQAFQKAETASAWRLDEQELQLRLAAGTH